MKLSLSQLGRWVAVWTVSVALLAATASLGANDRGLVKEARSALRRAAEFYRGRVAVHGDLVPSALGVLLEGERIYGGGAYRRAAERLGEFLIRAQLSDPQPA